MLADLPAKQRSFCLAMVECGSVSKAASQAKIAYQTGLRWMRDPEVAQAVDEARREATSGALAVLRQTLGEAVETLRDLLGREYHPSIRVRAASALLDASLKTGDLLSLDERLRAVEYQRLTVEHATVLTLTAAADD